MALDASSPSDTFWTAGRGGAGYPQLDHDLSVDVAVIGGGIVGLTAARYLAQSGRRVAVLEARRIGRQVTGGSTAKLTSQHSLRYRHLQETFGTEAARAYAEANQWGIEEIGRTAETLSIDCSFVRRPAYVFTEQEGRLAELQDEAELAAWLGLPARFVDEVPLSVPAVGSLVFDDQAQFDPYAYLLGLATDLEAAEVSIFERTRVTEVGEGSPHALTTAGGTVTAADVIVATSLPVIDDGQYFARAVPKAHLTLGARVSGEVPQGMFISLDEPTHSMRWEERADGAWLVLVGPKFQPGSEDTEAGFRDLEAYARQHFPVTSIEHRWWNEDYYSVDGLPYVGLLSSEQPHLYTATGFSGWGLTNGTVAARILADAIAGKPNAWASTFESTRSPISDESPVGSALDFVKENLAAAKAFVSDRLPHHMDLAEIRPGDGVTLDIGDEKLAVWRDDDGALRAVSALCTHLGCVVDWNAAMRTWDCGCHGSCFAADGAVLRGPAMQHLEDRTGRLDIEG